MKWHPYLKLDNNGRPCMAQQTYEPLISDDGKTFCKNYSWPNDYQYIETRDRPFYTEDVVNWFFENELKYINKFSSKSYAPEIIDINYSDKKIYLKWYHKSCNQIIYSKKNWPEKNWRDSIKDIMVDQISEGIYKLTMYPHCHYIDNTDNMRAIDWYGCVSIDNPFIEEKYMKGIIHDSAKFRIDETGEICNGKINLENMFKRSLSTHVLWGDHNMNYIYEEIFCG